MHIHIFQHVSFEGPGSIESWARQNDHKLKVIPLYKDDSLPRPETIKAAIFLGGPMSVTEEDKYTWLVSEKKLVKQLVLNNIPVLGICLGAQLIANALGAAIYANEYKEIGWFFMKKTPEGKDNHFLSDIPDHFSALHWHGETFDLPPKAKHLAFSEACKNQAFQVNHSLGLQFHFEANLESIKKLCTHCGHELVHDSYIQSQEQILSKNNEHYKILNQYMDAILNKWIKQ